MDLDTDIGGPQAVFPHTRYSAVLGTASADPELRERSFARLISAYWKPAYKHVRRVHGASNEDAKELVQGFFARALEKGWIARFDAARGRFRTYLRTCLDGHVADERTGATREKRGGAVRTLSLDFESAEEELRALPADPATDPDERFRREWVRELFSEAVLRARRELQGTGHRVPFALFERLDLQVTERSPEDRPAYAELARDFGLTTTQVTNYLALARRTFRKHALGGLRELCASEDEFRAEARALFGETEP
jgi:RNA polymerase sigma-70 factor (ECF subfamily)